MGPKEFVEAFFGEGNGLDIGNPQVGRHLEPWTSRVLEGGSPIALPRHDANTGLTTWYAIAFSAQGARELREELLAAVGPSYADFHGVGATLNPTDPVEAAILSFAGPFAFRLPVVDPSLRESCRIALERMLELHDRRPQREARPPRVAGLILRDLELALQQQDRQATDATLDELRAGGHIDGLNLRFLEVRCHEAFGEWATIYEEVRSETLLAVRRPVRVTQALIRAAYRVELAAFEPDRRAEGALEHFAASLQGAIAPLLETRAGMSAPEVAKLFMLKAAATGNSRLRDSLLEGSTLTGVDKVYLHALADLVRGPEPPVAASEDEASEAFLDGDKDRAFELLMAGGGGSRRIALLLRCALAIGTFHAVELALSEVEKLPPTERSGIEADPRLAGDLRALETQYTAPSFGVPTGWMDWVDLVGQGILDDNRALELAQLGASEWSLAELTDRPGDISQLAKSVTEVVGPGKSQLRLALPHLQAFLLSEDETSPALKPLLRALLELYALDEAQSHTTWRAAAEVLEALVRCGLTDAEYAEGIELLGILLGDALPLELIDDALDLLESFVTLAPGRPPTITASALIHGRLQRWRERLGRAQIDLFNQLGRELETGAEFALPEEPEADDGPTGLQRLQGKFVALYSLNERALLRVKTTLESLVADIRVETFSDKVGTDPLRSAARNADVFLIVTAAAKHAATEFIEASRSADQMTLRSHAKGSASMMRALEEAPDPQ